MLTLHRLKIILGHCWHTSWLTIMTLVLLAALLLGATRAITPLLARQKPIIEHWTSIVLQHPVKIKKLRIHWHYFEPMLHLVDVAVLNKAGTHALLAADGLTINFDFLGSLLNNQLRIESITLVGANLRPVNLTTAGDNNSDELLAWLFSIPKISLQNTAIIWHMPDQSLLPVEINAELRNQGQQHKLWGQATLTQIPPSQLTFVAELDGNLPDRDQLEARWYLQADNVALARWSKNYLKDIAIQQGSLNAKIWGFWQHDQLQSIQSLLTLQHVKFKKNNQTGYLEYCDSNSYWQTQPNNSWSLDTQLSKLTSSYWNNVPGVKNMQAFVHLTPQEGKAVITKQPLTIDFGPLFRRPVSLDQLAGQAEWKRQANNWLITATKLYAQNQDGTANGTVTLLLPTDNSSPTIDLHATGHVNSAQHIADYLPLTVLKPTLVEWLSNSIVKAADADTTFILQGQLKDFPFDQNNGTFLISSDIQGGELDYWPGWPAVKNIDAKLVFAGRRMDADVHSAQLLNTSLQNIHVAIPMLKKEALASLHIEGNVNDDLANGVAFLRASPLHGKLLDIVRNLPLQGPMQLHLQLAIPLEPTEIPTKVNGQINTHDGTAAFLNGKATLQHLQGQISFTQDGVTAPALTATLWDKPVKINLATQQATLLQAMYGDLTARLMRQAQGNGWSVILQSPDIQGQIDVPKNKQPIYASFERLHLKENLSESEQKWSPNTIPALNLTSNDFRYGDKQFGQINLKLSPLPDGIKIDNLQANAGAYTLNAKGTWRQTKAQDETQLQGILVSPNISGALTSWGLPAGISAQQSTIQFDLSWPGPAYDPSFKQSRGKIHLDFKNGQIMDVSASTKTKINIGRLLTSLSLQSLTKRLKLDFSDFNAKGFGFDTLAGNFISYDGNAMTDDTHLDSSIAQIDVSGRIGLTAEDYDLQLKVTPKVTTSLPVIAGLAGGPIVGLATWAASKVLNPAVDVMTTDHYQMTGPWSEPEIKKLP